MCCCPGNPSEEIHGNYSNQIKVNQNMNLRIWENNRLQEIVTIKYKWMISMMWLGIYNMFKGLFKQKRKSLIRAWSKNVPLSQRCSAMPACPCAHAQAGGAAGGAAQKGKQTSQEVGMGRIAEEKALGA